MHLQTSIHDRTQTIVAPMFLWSVQLSQICVAASFVVLPFQFGYLNDVFNKFRQLINSAEGASLFGTKISSHDLHSFSN